MAFQLPQIGQNNLDYQNSLNSQVLNAPKAQMPVMPSAQQNLNSSGGKTIDLFGLLKNMFGDQSTDQSQYQGGITGDTVDPAKVSNPFNSPPEDGSY